MEVTGVGNPIVLLKKSRGKEDVKKAASFCIRNSDIDESGNANMRIKYSNNHEELVKLCSL